MTGVPRLFDPALMRLRRERAERLAVPCADFLLARAAEDVAERLATVTRRFENAADIATPTLALADRIRESGQVDRIEHVALKGDELPLAPGSIDLAVSALALQWVDDLPGLLSQIGRALKPDGLFLAVLVGGDTLTELREVLTTAESELRGGAAPRIAPFADVRTMGALLQRAGFALPVTDIDRVTVRYDTMFHLTRDLRAMGATNILADRDPKPLTRAIAGRAASLYAERFSDPDGRIRATFDLISVSGWVPHESQQKPLKPGSAKLRLADALQAIKPAKE